MNRQDGFTLVEAIVAIVVLVFGLMAVTNLLMVGASSNAAANQGTAATASATRIMDMLKAEKFVTLYGSPTPNGKETFKTDDGAGPNCSAAVLKDWHCSESLPGVGVIHTHWAISGTDEPTLVYVRVRSEGVGALTGRRSRADFTTFRACTYHKSPSPCPDV